MIDAKKLAPESENLLVVQSIGPWLPLTASWLFNQVVHLPPRIKSHVVCKATENLDQFNVPDIHSLCGGSKFKLLQERVLRKLGLFQFEHFLEKQVKVLHPSVLHSHFGWFGWENMNVARRNALAHCVTFYGMDVNALPQSQPKWRARYKALFDQAGCILCEGPFMADCIKNLGCPAEKVHVHHLGVNVADISFRPRTWDDGQPLRVLIAATFREKKGIPFALAALGRLQKHVPMAITIIGDATPDALSRMEKERILATIDKYDMKPMTRLLGFQPHSVLLEEAYNHHIFLSPSVVAEDGDTEGGAPVSLIEMAASGMPIVSTRHCDIPSVVKHGQTGWLAEERDIDGLVEYITWFIDNRNSWREMLESGRAHVEVEYDARVQGVRLAGIYEALAAEAG